MRTFRYISLFCLAALLLACVREDELTEVAETSPSDKLCFRLGDVDTKLSYSGVTTSFADGDYIGAVVCMLDDSGSYEYYCTMRWKYNSGGKITPDKMWTYSSDDSSWTANSNLKYSSTSDSNPILTYDTDDEENANGYVDVTSSEDLFLFFYYPFIDPETTQSDVPSYTTTSSSSDGDDTSGETSSTTTLLMGMAGPSGAGNVTSTTDGSSTSVPSFDWETFPMFVNKDQSTSAKHQMSDFLWSNFTVGINSSSTGEHYVSFSKMTATIRVSSYKPISDIRLYSAITDDPIVIGQKIDLKDADLLDYESSDEVYNYTILGDSEYMLPYNNSSTSSDSDEETTYYYRFILPQQASFSGTLKVKFADDSSTEEEISSLGGALKTSSGGAFGGSPLSSFGRIVALDDETSYTLTLSCVDASSGETTISPTIYYYTGDSAPETSSSSWNQYSTAISVSSGITVWYYASADGYTTSTAASTTVYADTSVEFSLSTTSSDSSDNGSGESNGGESGDSGDSTYGSGGSSGGQGGSGGGGGMSTMADDDTQTTTSYNVTLSFIDSDSNDAVNGATIYYQTVASGGNVGDTWTTYSDAVSVASGSSIYYYASATGYTSSSASACSTITSATSITVDLAPVSYDVTLSAVDASGSTISSATMYYQIGSTSGDWTSVSSGSSVSVLYGRTIYYYATYDGDDYVSGSSSTASSSTITAASSLIYTLSDYWDISSTLSFTSLATGCIYYVDIQEYLYTCYFDKSDTNISYSTPGSYTAGLVTSVSDVFKWGYTSTTPSTFSLLSSSVSINGTSYSSYFKFEGGKGTYLEFTARKGAKVTLYATGSSASKSSVGTSLYFMNSSETITFSTITFSSDSDYISSSFTVPSKGTYHLKASSGQSCLLLVTIESP